MCLLELAKKHMLKFEGCLEANFDYLRICRGQLDVTENSGVVGVLILLLKSQAYSIV